MLMLPAVEDRSVSPYQRQLLAEAFDRLFASDNLTRDVEALFEQRFGVGLDDGKYSQAKELLADLNKTSLSLVRQRAS